MSHFGFEVLSERARARLGRIVTRHGSILTPEFLPVGTQATVKAVPVRDLEEVGTQALLANTYHLFLRPGHEVVRELGGLHRFMGWKRPIMTDSGGFQAFSLGAGREQGVGKVGSIFPGETRNPSKFTGATKLVKISEEGVLFRSHLDGSRHLLTPERSIQIQEALGADMILAFDECTSPLADRRYTELSLERTHRWAQRSLDARGDTSQALYGILQGGAYEDLRARSVEFITSLPFQGFAVGGSLGNTKQDMLEVLDWTVPGLPPDRPRHLLGIGDIVDLFEAVERGIDTFDCVIPTRFARNANVFVPPEEPGRGRRGTLNLTNACYTKDDKPICSVCSCYTCRNHSRAYLRHLYKAGEILASQLASIHNLQFLLTLMRAIREALAQGVFAGLKARWVVSF